MIDRKRLSRTSARFVQRISVSDPLASTRDRLAILFNAKRNLDHALDILCEGLFSVTIQLNRAAWAFLCRGRLFGIRLSHSGGVRARLGRETPGGVTTNGLSRGFSSSFLGVAGVRGLCCRRETGGVIGTVGTTNLAFVLAGEFIDASLRYGEADFAFLLGCFRGRDSVLLRGDELGLRMAASSPSSSLSIAACACWRRLSTRGGVSNAAVAAERLTPRAGRTITSFFGWTFGSAMGTSPTRRL